MSLACTWLLLRYRATQLRSTPLPARSLLTNCIEPTRASHAPFHPNPYYTYVAACAPVASPAENVGRATLPAKSLSGMQHSAVSGFFPVFAPSGKTIAEIQLSMHFAPAAMASTTSTASVPAQSAATAAASSFPAPTATPTVAAARGPAQPAMPRPNSARATADPAPAGILQSPLERSLDPFTSSAALIELAAGSGATPVAGGSGGTPPPLSPLTGTVPNHQPYQSSDANTYSVRRPAAAQLGPDPADCSPPDLLGSLLQRGEHLRNEMAISAFEVGDGAGPPDGGDGVPAVSAAAAFEPFEFDPDEPWRDQLEVNWLLDGLETSTDDVPLVNEALIEDLFYTDGGLSDPSDLEDSGGSGNSRSRGNWGGPAAGDTMGSGFAAAAAAAQDDEFVVFRAARTLDLVLGRLDLTGAAPERWSELCKTDGATFIVEHSFPAAERTLSSRFTSGECVGRSVDFSRRTSIPVAVDSRWLEQARSACWEFSLLFREADHPPVLVGRALIPLAQLLTTRATANVFALEFAANAASAYETGPVAVLQAQVNILADMAPGPAGPGSPLRPAPAGPLHALYLALHVEDARNIPARANGRSRNLYLVTRCLSPKDETQTRIYWNQLNPAFRHQHTIPVMESAELLDKLRMGAAVVEVWDRCATSDGRDELVGTC